MTKSDKSLESLRSRENTTVLSTAIITFIHNILIFFTIIILTMAVLTNIFTFAGVTQVSAVEICFTTFASVGQISLFRTATFYQLDYSLRRWRQSSHHRKPFVVLQLPAKKISCDSNWGWATMSLFQTIAW